jgi:hypothetical protein
MPRIANSPELEYKFSKAHSETFEVERTTLVGGREGSIRLLLSSSRSKAPSYNAAINAIAVRDTFLLKVVAGNEENKVYGGKKIGVGISADQQLSRSIGVFARLGWNDGRYATWAFTEIDHTASLGISVSGAGWRRSNDEFGLGTSFNGLSAGHRDFLRRGGYGFIIGDGRLNYGTESIIEAYYSAKLTKFLWLSIDYQFVSNPAFNRDRGPVSALALRGHVFF